MRVPDTAPGAPTDPTPDMMQTAVATATERAEALPAGSKRKAIASKRKSALKGDVAPVARKGRKAAKRPASKKDKPPKKRKTTKKARRPAQTRGKKSAARKAKAGPKRR